MILMCPCIIDFMYLRRSLWLFRNPPWFHKSCVFLYYIPLQWARRPMGARGWAADEGPLSNWPVLPDLCQPLRPASPLTLLVYGGDRGAQPTARYIFTLPVLSYSAVTTAIWQPCSWPMGRRGWAEGEGPLRSWPLSPHSHLTLIYWILLISPPPPQYVDTCTKNQRKWRWGGGGRVISKAIFLGP